MYDPDNPRPARQIASPQRSVADSLPSPLIERVWQVMAAMYGSAWTSQYGVDPSGDTGRLWARRLAGFTPEQIAQGLRACEKSDSAFTPSLPQFRKWCVGSGDDPQSHSAEVVHAQQDYLRERDRYDRLHFQRMNAIWRETHDADLFDENARGIA